MYVLGLMAAGADATSSSCFTDVHRSIKLCPITKLVMSTPQVQRLKGLKQLGTTDQTYMCATHTRFEHSIGVAGLAEQLLEEIRERQPKLNVTDKDIVCVKLAGLLHDLGHGPYSHVYDGSFRNQLSKAERKGSWLGVDFDSTIYDNLPEVKKNWQHEDASLEMIDCMLSGLGLAIDESNLDKPLKQIGHGVDALAFGIWDRSKEPERHIAYDTDDDESMSEADDNDDELYTGVLPPELVLTSRDWIFIKECVVASPLPPKGVSHKGNNARGQFVGRPGRLKEFLYDVVSNRHSGLDVDKMDYLARDTLHAFGVNGIADIIPKLLEKACVAWGRSNDSDSETSIETEDDHSSMHLMICYPDTMTHNILTFFERRYKEHQRLYTHPKT
ncbi:hypothetical protein THAOC_35122 [Thalassiosira oceanica]|uniref:HD/PDEase domain-containing protein n=1 Tax=Thalassiosira oceanica TaxID=159749 RepID=K0R1E3_THAOC|nr:hypothetical protein THAOC_35122 [Thalassiosira oceanica]|eukprot:EJK46223.1 hypothetical protein THAOC_35122 [Thalassiosira oceanica]